MTTKKQDKASILSIIDAVETLSSIADMDLEKDIGVAKEQDLVVQDKELFFKSVHWLTEDGSGESLHMIKEIFKVVLNHIKNFYNDDQKGAKDEQGVESIKTIMVLVGEAAKKLDKYTNLFHQSANMPRITELDEYKDLREFYQKRISNTVAEGTLGKWILGLSANVEEAPRTEKISQKERLKTKYIFIDLEAVKNDTEYELFFLRKEDGSRFFSPPLIKNMKLVSDFGNYFGEVQRKDPLISMDSWKDRCAHATSISILRALGSRIERFFHETARHRKGELAGIMNSAMMALLLCSHQENLLSNSPVKSCYEYFKDFQNFLYQAMHSREYQKFVVYQPRVSNKVANTLLETLHALCRSMIIHQKGYEEMTPHVQNLIQEENKEGLELSQQSLDGNLVEIFLQEYELMKTKMHQHPNGPLILLLNSLEEGDCNMFSPLRQKNLPVPLFSMYFHEKKIVNLRLPAPITQEFIDKVHIDETFHGFLRACEKDHIIRKHLLFNMQDRTSWREVARCQALEGLMNIPKFNQHIAVVTLAFDTEFYHQHSPYDKEDDAGIFINHFFEHLSDEGFGFYFSKSLSKALFPKFAKKLLNVIHRVFFASQNKLSVEARRDFIEIYYFFLVMKCIEIVKPDSYSMSCKDAIDVGGSFNLIIYLMLKLMNNEQIGQIDIDCIHYMTYMPALFVRERLMLPDRFSRFLSVLKVVEDLRSDYGEETFSMILSEAFDPLYESPIIHSQVIPSHS